MFTSPAAVAALRRAGLDEATLRVVARPIPAMRVETLGGTSFRLTYGADAGGEPAVGFDRSRLDPALLELARRAGADVRLGWSVTAVDPERRPARTCVTSGGTTAPIRRPGRRGRRRPPVDRRPSRRRGPARLAPGRRASGSRTTSPTTTRAPTRDARMRLLHDGYVGIAPVAGGRVNVGIVLGRSWRARLARTGARSRRRCDRRGASRRPTDDPADWRRGRAADAIAGAWPLGHRVTRRAGAGWLLVGDAAGFLDPFTGEGLHRASSRPSWRPRPSGRAPAGRRDAFAAYDRAMQRRFLAKDGVSWLVQAVPGPARPVRVRGSPGRRPSGRPCDDGPRDGRSRRRRPGARPALPRRAPRAVSERRDARATIERSTSTRPAGARLPARPRRRALGARCSPTTPGRERSRAGPDGSLVTDFVAVAPFVPLLGLGLPVAWRARTWNEPDDLPPPLRPRRRRDEGHGRDLADRAAADRHAGSRSSTTSARGCPASRRSSTAPSPGPSPAGRWPRSRPSPRRSAERTGRRTVARPASPDGAARTKSRP